MNKGYARRLFGRHLSVLALVAILAPSVVAGQDAFDVEADFLSTTWSIWRKTAERNRMCNRKPNPNPIEQLNNLSDDQFTALARDYPVVGVASIKRIYIREHRTYVDTDASGRSSKFPDFVTSDYKRNGNYHSFPIVCVAGDLNLVAEVNARLAKQPIIEPPGLFKGKKGGEYLSAIYTGNFDKQSTFARRYLVEMSTSIGGAMAHLMGGLAQTTGDSRIAKQELTVLEEVLSHYMTQYSRYGESCLSDGWFERRFTHELPDDVIFDQYGIETDRIDGGTSTTIYKLNKEFAAACDELCNTGGALIISAMAGNPMSRNKDYALGDVFRGIIDVLENEGCSNADVKRFEQSLLAMYAKESTVPLPDRNTLSNVINQN